MNKRRRYLAKRRRREARLRTQHNLPNWLPDVVGVDWGRGPSFVVHDEVAFWPSPRLRVSTACPITQGYCADAACNVVCRRLS